MPSTPIENLQSLTSHATALRALGLQSGDQVLGLAHAVPTELARYLNLSPEKLQELIAGLPQQSMPAALTNRPHRRLGVRLDLIPRRTHQAFSVPMKLAVPLPPAVNLITSMRPVRQQGNRGTCVAHASTAITEQYWQMNGRNELDLSRQFCYWDCKMHDGHQDEEGTWISIAVQRLVADGCPLESVWPYVADDVAGNEPQDPPPGGAVEAALQYRIPSFSEISPNSIPDIKACLAENKAVAFSIPVYNSWYLNSEVERTGDIINPIPTETTVGGHAMCMIGYQDEPDDLPSGGGKFLIRNSWGTDWAPQSLIAPGYGSIPYSYIARFGTEAYSIP